MTGKSTLRETIKKMFFAKKERPILFSNDMVKAILVMLKTMTRRTKGLEVINQNPDDWQFEWADFCLDKPWRFTQKSSINDQSLKDRSFHQEAIKCPYGKTGDVLWVRETWARVPFSAYNQSIDVSQLPIDPEGWEVAVFKAGWDRSAPRWKPSIHMPKVAARIWLEITDIRVERLQDISDVDAASEGIDRKTEKKKAGMCTFYKDYCNRNDWYWSAKASFMSLWQKINGRESWRANPWVWVISFKVLSTTGKPATLEQEVANA